MSIRIRTSGIALLVALVSASSAQAGDGRIEINQTAALAGGITSCDGPGFPVTICKSGSYVLTSDLNYDSAAADGIVATVNDVSIDLNGMAVVGTNTVTTGSGFAQWVVSSSQFGNHSGITLQNQSIVQNGRVSAAQGTGVFVGNFTIVRDLSISACGGTGIIVIEGGHVSNVSTSRNAGQGIYVGDGTVVENVTTAYNESDGLASADLIVAERISAARNGGSGILLGRGSRIAGVTAYRNGLAGVFAFDGSFVDSGSIRDNGKADATRCGIMGSGGASYRGVNITAFGGGNPSIACGMLDGGGNFCQGVACP